MQHFSAFQEELQKRIQQVKPPTFLTIRPIPIQRVVLASLLISTAACRGLHWQWGNAELEGKSWVVHTETSVWSDYGDPTVANAQLVDWDGILEGTGIASAQVARVGRSNAEDVSIRNTPGQVRNLDKRDKQLAYVKRFAKVAQEEMRKFGIPASVTLAQGLLESNVGESALAVKNNNHFGMKCWEKSCAPGHCTNYKDDTHKDFFRRYNSAWESYRAHSHFLQKERYQSLFRLGRKNYKAWAKGLQKAGYATDQRYASKLIRIIEDLHLDRYDR
ncbi:MAG: glucosaminidase domain-containing protein, partial [Bacteroidota bacterium]